MVSSYHETPQGNMFQCLSIQPQETQHEKSFLYFGKILAAHIALQKTLFLIPGFLLFTCNLERYSAHLMFPGLLAFRNIFGWGSMLFEKILFRTYETT